MSTTSKIPAELKEALQRIVQLERAVGLALGGLVSLSMSPSVPLAKQLQKDIKETLEESYDET